MVEFEIHPEKSALLLVDMTNAFVGAGTPLEIPGARDLAPKLNGLISSCRSKGIKVIFVVHAHRRDGSDIGLFSEFIPGMGGGGINTEGTADVAICDELDYCEDDTVVVKRTYSAFYGTDLDHILRCRGIDTLIIGGVATNYCCETTARDARVRNYKVIFLSDGTAPLALPDLGWGGISGDEAQRFVLTTMAYRCAQVLSVKDVSRRLR